MIQLKLNSIYTLIFYLNIVHKPLVMLSQILSLSPYRRLQLLHNTPIPCQVASLFIITLVVPFAIVETDF